MRRRGINKVSGGIKGFDLLLQNTLNSGFPVNQRRQLSISEDGNYISMLYYSNDNIYTWQLTNPFSLASGNVSFLNNLQTNVVAGWASCFCNNGNTLVSLRIASGGRLYVINCPTAYSLAGSTLISVFLGTFPNYEPQILVKPDGLTFWVCASSQNNDCVIREFSLNIPFDFSTFSLVNEINDLSTTASVGSIGFLQEGNYVFYQETFSSDIHLKKLGVPYKLETAENIIDTKSLGFSAFNIYKTFSNDTKLYASDGNGIIHEFNVTLI